MTTPYKLPPVEQGSGYGSASDYRILKPGEVIKDGDQILCIDGQWGPVLATIGCRITAPVFGIRIHQFRRPLK